MAGIPRGSLRWEIGPSIFPRMFPAEQKISGWWLKNLFEKYEFVSWDYQITTEWKSKKTFQTTNQIFCSYVVFLTLIIRVQGDDMRGYHHLMLNSHYIHMNTSLTPEIPSHPMFDRTLTTICWSYLMLFQRIFVICGKINGSLNPDFFLGCHVGPLRYCAKRAEK